MGNKINTNKVSFILITNIMVNEITIVKGSRTTASNEVKNEFSIS